MAPPRIVVEAISPGSSSTRYGSRLRNFSATGSNVSDSRTTGAVDARLDPRSVDVRAIPSTRWVPRASPVAGAGEAGGACGNAAGASRPRRAQALVSDGRNCDFPADRGPHHAAQAAAGWYQKQQRGIVSKARPKQARTAADRRLRLKTVG